MTKNHYKTAFVAVIIIFTLFSKLTSIVINSNSSEVKENYKTTVPALKPNIITPPNTSIEFPLILKYNKDTMPNTYHIDMKIIYQNPELPTGCEITSLAILLNYLGYNIDKITLTKEHLDYGYNNTVTFRDQFIGSPFSVNSYGCFAPVIVNAATSYLNSVNSNHTPLDMTGTEFKDLLVLVSNNYPVIVWSSMYLVPIKNKLVWYLKDGTPVYWPENEHVMVINGYDLNKNIITVIDPLRGQVAYNIDNFTKIYNALNKQAVTII